ncbi:hypothetical protein U1Q18_006787 [Sarracenia purpurea var. burkii]
MESNVNLVQLPYFYTYSLFAPCPKTTIAALCVHFSSMIQCTVSSPSPPLCLHFSPDMPLVDVDAYGYCAATSRISVPSFIVRLRSFIRRCSCVPSFESFPCSRLHRGN